MWTESDEIAQPRTSAEISCQLCRRRKVKCDRTLPHCQVCIQTDQVCEYPLRPKKPGPKIGSLQRHRRRDRHRRGTNGGSANDSTHASTARSDKWASRSSRSSASGAEGRQEHSGRSVNDANGAVAADPPQADKTPDRGHRPAMTNTASPSGSTSDEWTRRRRNSRLNISDLSFILHPSHEASTPDNDGDAVHGDDGGSVQQADDQPSSAGPTTAIRAAPSPRTSTLVQQAGRALGISEAILYASLQSYFANMVAINLFHRPSFGAKLRALAAASPVQLQALLAAMTAYAARFLPETAGQAGRQQSPQPTLLHRKGMDMDCIDPTMATLQGMDTTAPALTPPTASATSMPPPPLPPATPEHFLDMARRLIAQALEACGDDPPTLAILQASIICTHCELTRGVHGRAWRSLGMCVRLAYEMNLHLVDARSSLSSLSSSSSSVSSSSSATSWRDAEEKRRAWWAIWEMDVFASTIRRTPTAVDWTQMETLLPVDDADWFVAASDDHSSDDHSSEARTNEKTQDETSGAGTKDASGARTQQAPQTQSCFLELDPVRRWKALQASGNQSPKAWFLVINSLMKDARVISSPRGVRFHEDRQARKTATASSPRHKTRPAGPCPAQEARQTLEILANCVQCFVLALPVHLQYRNQFLGFGEGTPDVPVSVFADTSGASAPPTASSSTPPTVSTRQLHCGIYNIYVMTQLTRLMIHRYELFGAHAHAGTGQMHMRLTSSSSSVLPYFEAADNILTIVNRSCEEHIRYINPFLLSTLWLAAAVQLVRRYVAVPRPGRGQTDRRTSASTGTAALITSRFDVLYMTYKRGAAFWNDRTAMEQNLEALEAQLEKSQGGGEGVDDEGPEGENESEVDDIAADEGANHAKRRASDRSDDEDNGHQTKKTKKIRVTRATTKIAKENTNERQKKRPTRVNGTGRASQAGRQTSPSGHRTYTSWTSSTYQPQLSPTSLPREPPRQTQTQAHEQLALVMTHPNLQASHPQQQQPPPTPRSTYSDPTDGSSLFANGDMMDGVVGRTADNTANCPRRPTVSSVDYSFPFASPLGQNSTTSANGYAPAILPENSTDTAHAQAQALLAFIQLSAEQHGSRHQNQDGRDSFVVDTPSSTDLPSVPLSVISPSLFEPDLAMDDMQMQQQQQGSSGGGGSNSFEWRGLDLPMDIHDLLSGFSTY